MTVTRQQFLSLLEPKLRDIRSDQDFPRYETIYSRYFSTVAQSKKPTETIFNESRHPYTKGLLGAIKRLGAGREVPLQGIPGAVPDLLELPSGCTFHPRCGSADKGCTAVFPPSEVVGPDHECACYKA